MNEEQMATTIPYFAHEGEMARMERANKRLFWALLVTLVMLLATNAGWIYYESRFSTYDVEQDVDTGNGTAVVAGVGDVIYGENQAEDPGTGAENQR